MHRGGYMLGDQLVGALPAISRMDASDREPSSSFDQSTPWDIEPDFMFQRFERMTRRVFAIRQGIFFTFALFLILLIALEGGVRSVAPNISIPVVLMFVFGSIAWFSAATVQWWFAAAAVAAGKVGLSVYVIGYTPFPDGYLILGKTALFVTSRRGERLATFAYRDVAAIAIQGRMSGVCAVFSVRDKFFELPVVLRAGGPTAQSWSIDGFLGRKKLFRAVVHDMRGVGLSVTEL